MRRRRAAPPPQCRQPRRRPSPSPSLAALLGALLGGLILNLMPCVFPVLAIKVVGFAQHAQNRRAHRIRGMAYTAGVVLSFIALGALMLGLRAAGEAMGWGFQLQSPAVVAALAALFTLIGLNLAGRVRVRQLSAVVGGQPAGAPPGGRFSFLTGVLAVAVASPCTAPFMGASLGLTATLPAAQALAVFAAIGLGWRCRTWPPACARRGARPAAPRRVDGHLPQADGLPHVCHRGLAGVGAGPAKRH
jgi:thiol:disulfide interchange protein